MEPAVNKMMECLRAMGHDDCIGVVKTSENCDRKVMLVQVMLVQVVLWFKKNLDWEAVANFKKSEGRRTEYVARHTKHHCTQIWR